MAWKYLHFFNAKYFTKYYFYYLFYFFFNKSLKSFLITWPRIYSIFIIIIIIIIIIIFISPTGTKLLA